MVSDVPTQTTGRLAFRYFVVDAGPSEPNADYIGIDTVSFTGTCPPPITPTPTPTASDFGGTPTATATATATAATTATPTVAPVTPTPSPSPRLSISGAVSYCSNPASDPVPGVTLTLSGTSSGATSSDNS